MSQVLNIDEAIIKELARLISIRFDKMNLKQSYIAEKMGISQGNVSLLLKGVKNTRKINNYRELASAIGIHDNEFEMLLEDAKRNTLGDSGAQKVNEDDPDIAYATLARNFGVSPDDVKKAIEIYKAYKN